MTENDLSVARDIGSLQADVRTIKHDVSNMSGKLDALGVQVGKINTKHERSLGFFAGMAFVFTACGGLLIALAKVIFGGHA